MSYIPDTQQLDKTAFGELLTAEITPKVQVTAQYGTAAKLRSIVNGAGASAIQTGGEVVVNSGTDTFGLATYFSKRAISYRAGQGVDARITSRFTTTNATSSLLAGLISATDSMTFGYIGSAFGAIHQHNGQQTIEKLSLTTAATASENATVTINGSPFTVALTNSTAPVNCKEIADSLNAEPTLALWLFQQVDSTVVVRSLLSGVNVGAFTFSSGTAIGAFSTVAAGVDISEDFTPQTSWNVDKATWLDPSKGNVYRFKLQYLGYGNLDYEIEDPETGHFTLVHRVKWANANTQPSFRNPSFRVGWATSNRGGTNTATMSGASVFAGTEGIDVVTSDSQTLLNDKTGITTALTNILTIKTLETFGQIVNLSSIIPSELTAYTDSTKGVAIELILDATLGGTPLFDYLLEDESLAIYDTAGTTVTGGKKIASFSLTSSGGINIDLSKYNMQVLPGQQLTIAARVISGAASDVSCGLVWDEDI